MAPFSEYARVVEHARRLDGYAREWKARAEKAEAALGRCEGRWSELLRKSVEGEEAAEARAEKAEADFARAESAVSTEMDRADKAEADLVLANGLYAGAKEAFNGAEARVRELEEEVAVDNVLIDERNRLLAEFNCPLHGKGCVPHAIEEVRNVRQRVRELEERPQFDVIYMGYDEHGHYTGNVKKRELDAAQSRVRELEVDLRDTGLKLGRVLTDLSASNARFGELYAKLHDQANAIRNGAAIRESVEKMLDESRRRNSELEATLGQCGAVQLKQAERIKRLEEEHLKQSAETIGPDGPWARLHESWRNIDKLKVELHDRTRERDHANDVANAAGKYIKRLEEAMKYGPFFDEHRPNDKPLSWWKGAACMFDHIRRKAGLDPGRERLDAVRAGGEPYGADAQLADMLREAERCPKGEPGVPPCDVCGVEESIVAMHFVGEPALHMCELCDAACVGTVGDITREGVRKRTLDAIRLNQHSDRGAKGEPGKPDLDEALAKALYDWGHRHSVMRPGIQAALARAADRWLRAREGHPLPEQPPAPQQPGE